MRSSMKVPFSQDANGLSSMAFSMTRPEKRVNTNNCPEKNYIPTSDKNKLLLLGNIGRSSNLGLGLILPPTVGLQRVQDQETAGFSVLPDVSNRVSAPAFCQMPETPFLDPLHLDEDISPILSLPLSLHSVVSPVQHPNSEPLPAESAPLYVEDMNQVITQDITSMALNDDSFEQDDVKTIHSSPVQYTPTVDIAEYGVSSWYPPDKAASVGEPYPKTDTKYPTKGSPLLRDSVGLPIILSAVPVYHGKSRDDNRSPSTPPSHDGTRSLSPYAVFRPSAAYGHRRSYKNRRPIETSSPSMTPSPTNSPKLYRLPLHRKEGDRETRLLKGLSLESSVVIPKTSRHHSSVLCAQLPKRCANVHESIRTNTRCSPWNSPIFKSPLAPSCQFTTNELMSE